MEVYGDTFLRSASSCCEACGRPIPATKNGVKLEANILSYNGEATRLTFREAAMAELLLKHFGETVHKERIWTVVWDNSDRIDQKIVDVMQCKLNAKLAPLGLRVRSTWGIGKTLNFADPVVANVAKTRQEYHDPHNLVESNWSTTPTGGRHNHAV